MTLQVLLNLRGEQPGQFGNYWYLASSKDGTGIKGERWKEREKHNSHTLTFLIHTAALSTQHR